MSPRRTLVAATAFLGLAFAGSAASAVPVPIPGHDARSEGPQLRERLRTQFERSFGGLNPPDLRSATPKAPGTAAIGSADPFPGLASGQFAAYASATVNHTAARLVGKEVDHDANIAASHAAHSQAAAPRWDSETGRAAFPDLAAGSSIGRALAAEFSESGAAEEDSVLPLDPVEAKAPPSSAPVTDGTDIDVPPLLKSRTLRADASARALNGGCVLGNDLALGRANADAKALVDTKGDAKNPAPLLSLAADDPRRGVAQSLARTRLVPLPGQANRFGLLAETRQTVAPVTFFEGEANEMTIEVAGEWILRAVADGAKGFVTLDVERDQDDDRPLLRIISRSGGGKEVQTVGDLDEFHALNAGGLTLSNGVTVVLGESIRGLRGDTGSESVATGTRAAGALDIFRLQTSDDPADAIARVGHMEAAVAVPTGGATCPGVGITKRSTTPTVDAGGRFSWLLDISNPNDCVLDKVKVLDTIQSSRGLDYRVTATSPPGRVDGDTITFDQLGPLHTGATRNLRIDVEVDPNTAAGRFTNQAVATGLCGSVPVSGAAEEETEVDPPSLLDVVGRAGANEPAVRVPAGRSAAGVPGPARSPGDVIVRPVPGPSPSDSDSAHGDTRTSSSSASRGAPGESSRRAGAALARTGGATSGLLGMALCGIGLAFRRFRPHRGSA
jgi:hypothetical protein